MENLTRVEIRRIHVDKGYRGNNCKEKFRVWITNQVHCVTHSIHREIKRRAAVEPVIRHLKADQRIGPNSLKGRDGDCANAVLAASSYNFALLLAGSDCLCAPSRPFPVVPLSRYL